MTLEGESTQRGPSGGLCTCWMTFRPDRLRAVGGGGGADWGEEVVLSVSLGADKVKLRPESRLFTRPVSTCGGTCPPPPGSSHYSFTFSWVAISLCHLITAASCPQPKVSCVKELKVNSHTTSPRPPSPRRADVSKPQIWGVMMRSDVTGCVCLCSF